MSTEDRTRYHMTKVKKKTLDFMTDCIVNYQQDSNQNVTDPLAVTTTLAAMQACLVEAYGEHLGKGDAAEFFYGIADDLAVQAKPKTRFKKFK
tara:strand:+ start:259 stop:537 length:279 start_codon:yes stop_codon:yes gene_type:complete